MERSSINILEATRDLKHKQTEQVIQPPSVKPTKHKNLLLANHASSVPGEMIISVIHAAHLQEHK